MYKLITRNKPRGALVRNADDTHGVRVYKNSPETLNLQIWSGRRYMLVSLSPQEARDIAGELVADADMIEHRQEPVSSVECPHCHWGFHPAVINQHIREKHDA